MGRTVIAGRYELDDLPIGRGGMGEVWGGYDQRLDRRVAVKFIRFPDGRPSEELIRRFVREARITARLEHPGVPTVYDAGTHDGDLFLVMQLIHGVTVGDLVAEHERLPVAWAAAIAAQTCAVLVVAHARSLVHRDLKPNNLMLCADGTVKVLDFGLAAAFEPTDLSRITQTGQALGTPAYMAPEQAMTGRAGPRSDLYSLGCVLHEMLTGRQPFTAPTPLAVMHAHMDRRPRPVRSLRRDVPADLERLVLELLAKKPEERPGNAAEVYERLLPFAADLPPLPGVLRRSPEPDAVRMYATVVGRIDAAGAAPGVGGVARRAGGSPQRTDSPQGKAGTPDGVSDGVSDGVPDGAPGTPRPRGRTAVPPAATPVGRPQLARARHEAVALKQQGRFSQAAEALSAVVAPAATALGADDTDVISLRLELADVLFLGGDYPRAASAFRELAADLARRHSPDDDLVLRCRLQEATCRAVIGETGTALRLLEALREDQERIFGRDDERPLETRRQIGLLLLGSNDPGRARAVLSDLLDDLVRRSGADDSRVREIREILAGLDREAST